MLAEAATFPERWAGGSAIGVCWVEPARPEDPLASDPIAPLVAEREFTRPLGICFIHTMGIFKIQHPPLIRIGPINLLVNLTKVPCSQGPTSPVREMRLSIGQIVRAGLKKTRGLSFMPESSPFE